MASTEDGASAAAAARRRSGLQNPETATQTRRGRSPQPAESTPASAAEVNGRMSSGTGQRLSCPADSHRRSSRRCIRNGLAQFIAALDGLSCGLSCACWERAGVALWRLLQLAGAQCLVLLPMAALTPLVAVKHLSRRSAVMVHPQRRHPNHKPAGSRSIDTRPRAACSWRTTGPSIRSGALPVGFPVFEQSLGIREESGQWEE